ncbi:hypothetical protein [Dankookia sp. P2]|uniref:hypothetical protein n=1 Tax=Dankookia sp. P2 TaxID=3423955 RepID=UPI003D66BE34
MKGESNLVRRLSALEGKTAKTPETICMFLMPGESEEAALARRFGSAGAPQNAKVLVFTWQPMQDEPEQRTSL